MKQVANPPNPFLSENRELLEPAPAASIQVFEERINTILSKNESPDLPFRWSVNPYRGCFHACAYCYARPTHEYWGFGAGTDFESKLIVKPNASALLRAAFLKPTWRGELVVFSGNTDPYQPLEANYQTTRACLKVCVDFGNPVGIITKSSLVLRDLDILQELNRTAWVRVYFSIPFAKDETARKVEPQAPSISRRLAAMSQLSEAGIATGVSIAPIIPGLNDQDIPKILHMARQAGATEATYILLRLNDNVESVFLERMRQQFPDRVLKIIHHLLEMRKGKLSERTFFKRHEGHGVTWKTIEQMFDIHYRKAGFHLIPNDPIPNTFRRPGPQQMPLFPINDYS